MCLSLLASSAGGTKISNWSAFQSVSNHVVRAKGNKLDDTSKVKFAHVMSVNIDKLGVLPVD